MPKMNQRLYKKAYTCMLVILLMITSTGCSSYMESSYMESVTISPENIDEYFDVIEYAGFKRNLFGDANYWSGYMIYRLKDEYQSEIVLDQSSIAIESVMRYSGREVMVDFEEEMWGVGETIENGDDVVVKVQHSLQYGVPDDFENKDQIYYIIIGDLIPEHGVFKATAIRHVYSLKYIESYNTYRVEGVLTLKKQN